MNIVIVHRPQRFDRIPNVAELLKLFPSARVLEAKTANWERSPHNAAVRGCTLSHLSAVRAFLDAGDSDKSSRGGVLIFEDDALAVPHFDVFHLQIGQIPVDAGIVLYGGDTEKYGPPDENGFREVFPKFWGTHATYYLPALLRSPFLLNALEIAASSCLGQHPNISGLCLESVLILAMQGTGLKLYRPEKMSFTVIDSPGDSGTESNHRDKTIIAETK